MYEDNEEEDVVLEAAVQPAPEQPIGSITITINMDQYLSSGTLEEKIAYAIANAVSTTIQKSVEKKTLALVEARIEEELTESAAMKLQELFDLPIQKYNTWGSREGEPEVLRNQILNRMETWLKETVRKSDGKQSTPEYRDKATDFMPRLVPISPTSLPQRRQRFRN